MSCKETIRENLNKTISHNEYIKLNSNKKIIF